MMESKLIRHDWNGDTREFAHKLFLAFSDNNRVAILVPCGEHLKIIQRIRMFVSRRRKQTAKKQLMVKPFRLGSEFFPYTSGSGKRAVCIVFRALYDEKETEVFNAVRSYFNEN